MSFFLEMVVYLEKIQLQQKTGDSRLEASHHDVNTYTRKSCIYIYIYIDMHIFLQSIQTKPLVGRPKWW